MAIEITQNDIDKARNLIYELAGINLQQNKDSIIKNRLDKLVRDCAIINFNDFFNNVKTGLFRQEFINAFTTNKTDFFREIFHFRDMMDRILPKRIHDGSPIKVYCSASSSGEEPYSIASTLLWAKEIYRSSTPVSVLASDIDTNMLKAVQSGEYIVDIRLNPLPKWIDLHLFFNIEKISEYEVSLKAKANVKSILTLKQLNLFSKQYLLPKNEYDIIFCRNVLIYFKIEDQQEILRKLFELLKIGGTLYLGHSESILDLASKVDRLGQNIFVKRKE